FLPLSGEHQARNAATALAAVEAFFGAGGDRQLDVDKVREGFATVASPGRLERVRATPSVFIDASHNPHGAAALAKAVDRDFDFRRLIGVVAVLGDKDARGILAALEPVLDDVVITEVQSPRALPVDVLAEYARDAFGEERVHVAEQLPTAVETAIQLAEDDSDGMLAGAGVLVTGSVVTAGEALERGPRGPGHAPANDPMKGIGGVMAGTLILGGIVMLLGLSVVGRVDSGLGPVWLQFGYVLAVAVLMFAAAFMQKADSADK